MRAALAALALLIAAPAALAAADSLVLQPSATTTPPGGTVEIRVLARLHPDGKAVVPVRAADLSLTAKGGGTVAPASAEAGETRWIYTAPESVAGSLDVVVEARVRSYPDASGSCALRVAGPVSAKPAPAGGPAAAEDEEGDVVEGAEAVAAEAVGKLVTLTKWRARAGEGEEWNEKKIPARGEGLYAPGLQQEIRFRVNVPATAVEVHWWRNDRPKGVRAFTARNRQLDLSRDQDGLFNGRFSKNLGKEKGEYTFSIVVTTADGKTLRENVVLHRARPPKDGDEGKDDGKGGGKKR